MTEFKTKDVDLALEKIYNKIMQVCEDSDEAFLFVYCAGHGVAGQQQYYVTNEAET